jgi:threonine/homoserine/homoserine lactone efflux protein
MTLLAMVPSVSVLAVSARAASSGFRHGVYVTLGIITGDTVFIVLAIFGLQLLVAALGEAFVFIEYLGGVYLIVLASVCGARRRRHLQARLLLMYRCCRVS